jgi:hypothetical protein
MFPSSNQECEKKIWRELLLFLDLFTVAPWVSNWYSKLVEG